LPGDKRSCYVPRETWVGRRAVSSLKKHDFPARPGPPRRAAQGYNLPVAPGQNGPDRTKTGVISHQNEPKSRVFPHFSPGIGFKILYNLSAIFRSRGPAGLSIRSN
jgi:hypothetical protein